MGFLKPSMDDLFSYSVKGEENRCFVWSLLLVCLEATLF